jgi:hypothetical protein
MNPEEERSWDEMAMACVKALSKDTMKPLSQESWP